MKHTEIPIHISERGHSELAATKDAISRGKATIFEKLSIEWEPDSDKYKWLMEQNERYLASLGNVRLPLTREEIVKAVAREIDTIDARIRLEKDLG